VSLGDGVLLLFETGQCRVLLPGEEGAQLKPWEEGAQLSPWGEAEQQQAR
jgi:hypothetical protein